MSLLKARISHPPIDLISLLSAQIFTCRARSCCFGECAFASCFYSRIIREILLTAAKRDEQE